MICLVVLLWSGSVAGVDCPVGDFPVQWASPPHTPMPGELLDAMQKLTLTEAEAEELRVWNTGRANGDRSSLSCVDYLRENEPSLAPDADGEWNWHGASWKSSQFVRGCIATVPRRARQACAP
jgi:hypothetical protein